MTAIAADAGYDPSVCVARAGEKGGRWVYIDDSSYCPTLTRAEIEEMFDDDEDNDDNDWEIVDARGFGDFIWETLRTCSLEELCTLASLLSRYDADLVHAVSEYTVRIDELCKALDEHYAGQFDSLRDWAENFLDDTGYLNAVDENTRRYFDYDAWARDAELGGDIWTLQHGGYTHVFWSH